MSGNLIKTFSASCKAHAVLEWTIESARSLPRHKKMLESEYLPFRHFGFGESSLRWNLQLDPDPVYDNKPLGHPQYVGLFLLLSSEDSRMTNPKVEASFTLEVMVPKTDTWEMLMKCEHAKFDTRVGTSYGWGIPKAFSWTQCVGLDSDYVSANNMLTVRAVVDFEIASNPASHHAVASARRLADLYASKYLTDFELVSTDQEKFPVHRAVLAAHSSVFRVLCTRGREEKDTGPVDIKDVNGDTLNILLKFIYSGDITKVKDAAEKVLEAADKYAVSDLRNLAEHYLCEGGITVENAYRLSVMAEQRNLPDLRKAVSTFIVKNWVSLRETTEFVQFKANNGHMFDVLEAACRSKDDKVMIHK